MSNSLAAGLVTFLFCSMTTRYAEIGLPPSSAVAVHLTVSEEAPMSAAVDVMLGEPGAPEKDDLIKTSASVELEFVAV